LSEEEWVVMKAHTTKGEEICRPMKSLAPVLPIIRSHHERWDGSGYPDGLAGEQTPLLARILQVADVYDALTTERPYKKASSHDDAIRILNEEVGKGWRDPALVSLFHEVCTQAVQHSGLPTAVWTEPSLMRVSLANMSTQLLRQS